MPIIADEWNDYRRKVLPATAPAGQVQECKRAFYAGGRALLTAILNILDPSSDDATERDLRVMDSIDRELREFVASVEAGKN
jgi:hypothetical protein